MNWVKRFTIYSHVLAGASALSSAALATQPLDAFLERAGKESFDTREADATQRQRAAEAGEALGRLTPSFTARGIYTRNQSEVAADLPGPAGQGGPTERLVITPLNQLDAIFQLDVPIIDLANYHRYKAARYLEKAAGAQREATTIDVSRSVARAYYQYLGASALARSAEQSINAADANQKSVDIRRQAGAATELDLERASANTERSRQDFADALLGVALAGRSLETLSGLSPEQSDGTLQEDDLHMEGALQSWLDLAAKSPGTRAVGHLRDAGRQGLSASTSTFIPTLSALGREQVSNATGFAGRSTNYSIQLILAWRFDYGLMAADRAQEASIQVQEVQLERTERAIADAAFEAYHRVQAGIAKSRAARAQSHAATRAAGLAQERYSVGAATQLDVTEAQRDAFLATASQIQADSDLAFARASLRLAAGVPLSAEAPSAPEK
jgi:outer membrane protein TolC